MKRSSQGSALAGMARPKLLAPGIGGAGGILILGKPAGEPGGGVGSCLALQEPRDVGSPSFLQHLPWVVAASPQSISAKELFLGTFSYSVHLSLAQREEALERSSLSLEVPSLKERGPENQTDSFGATPTLTPPSPCRPRPTPNPT